MTNLQQAIIQPLRFCRQHLKGLTSHGPDVQQTRRRIKQLELNYEQLEQWLLYQLSETIASEPTEKQVLVRSNLKVYFEYLGLTKENQHAWIQAAERHLYP